MRAVIYCRVSTEEEVQVNALKCQVQEAVAAIRNKGWQLVDQYIDEGKSGTTTHKRDEYNRLVDDIQQDKFDVIVIKSQDRLMRNTKEWYIFVDIMVQAQKKLYFYLDNKFYTPDDALLTGIRAILAEEYSRELSKKINNAHRHRQKKGSNVIITSHTWGYDKINKEVVINEREAEIVRLIFSLCCDGYGSRVISKKLESKGIKSRTGRQFPEITVRRIIRNPLYMGTAVMNKQHIDFDTKKTIQNKPEEWIIHENIVPAIVSKEVWEKANQMMESRAIEEKTDAIATKLRGRNKGKHLLSGKIICGYCGSPYWLRSRRNAKGEQLKEWSCCEYVKRGRKTASERSRPIERIGGCDNVHVKDSDLEEILYQIGQKIFTKEGLEQMQHTLMSVIEKAINYDEVVDVNVLKAEQQNVMVRRGLLLDKLLDGTLSEELFKMKDKELKEQYDSLTCQVNEIEQKEKAKESYKERLKEIFEEINDINDRALVLARLNEHITKITIFKEYGIVSLDFLDDIKFNIRRINYMKVEYTL